MKGKVGLLPLMTLCIFVLLTIIGYIVGRMYNIAFLKIPFYMVFFLGVIICFVLIIQDRWQPFFPACKSGKCRKWKDYEYIKSVHDAKIYRCRCGNEYYRIHNRKTSEIYFMEFLNDGTTCPYMKHARFGRWGLDEDNS
jgi:hypothetical protein